jgi:PhnB protein
MSKVRSLTLPVNRAEYICSGTGWPGARVPACEYGVDQMPINPYINFAGNCREAVNYYADVFETQPIQMQTFGEMPADPNRPLPEQAKNLIMHAELHIAGSSLMFSDTFPGMPLNVGNNISLTVVSTDRDAIVNAFNELKKGGHVSMDLQETFWTKLYGMVTDKFGVPWQFSLDSGEMPR